jgi:hypothetical protein
MSSVVERDHRQSQGVLTMIKRLTKRIQVHNQSHGGKCAQECLKHCRVSDCKLSEMREYPNQSHVEITDFDHRIFSVEWNSHLVQKNCRS